MTWWIGTIRRAVVVRPQRDERRGCVSTIVAAMPFGRRKAAHKSRDTRARDPFEHLADERRAAESDAWFLQPDDGPELDVQAGVSSNLSDDDLDTG